MPKTARTLTVKEIERKVAAIATAGKGKTFAVGGVQGLSVEWINPNNCRWILRYRLDGKEKKHVIGPCPKTNLNLREAREKAAEFIANGYKCPEAPSEEATPQRVTVAELWPQFVTDMVNAPQGWKDKRAPSAKTNFGEKHIFPMLGGLAPEEIHLQQVAYCLNGAKSESIRDKCLTIIRQFLDWCLARGYGVDTEATRRSALKTLLVSTETQIGNWPSLDWRDVPRFFACLTKGGIRTVPRAALIFNILTASRTEPIRFANWADVSDDLSEWICQAQTMKGEKDKGTKGRDHYVPLSTQAKSLLRLMRNLGRKEGFVFGMGDDARRPMSSMTMSKSVGDLNETVEARGELGFRDKKTKRRVVPHGFRASFRTWADEGCEGIDGAGVIAEYCLAHRDGRDKFDGAYIRAEFKPQRRQLLQAWANYCLSQCPADWCKW